MSSAGILFLFYSRHFISARDIIFASGDRDVTGTWTETVIGTGMGQEEKQDEMREETQNGHENGGSGNEDRREG